MSNTEYPKMLYSGDKEGYSSRIIHSAEEEQQFREIGLQDYADLPDPEPKIEELAPGEAPTGFVTTEQFDAVAERLAAAESEIERLKQATANEMSSDYNSMTADQLRALLDEKGIEYKARDSKAELIALLG
ncbi:HeH/LEM domain-containing protein [Acinetobacter sp. YH12200]|uniref:HeH/LEM domain-containing protein n=1 Tax=Acinetobacter sp. YH12200 TaxID=2601139 RepID=UPI0015D40F57|nr:HeH/LEM domain-containing protein [Acinetobacter sp. YH12200]